MDLILRNANILMPDDIIEGDISIKDGLIQGIHSSSPCNAKKEIDLKGKLVMPGAIDAHTHFELSGYNTVSSDDFFNGTSAAAYGGVTSIVDFTCQTRGHSLTESLDTRLALAKKAVIDYSFHIGVTEFNDRVRLELPKMIEKGCTSYKLFTIYEQMMLSDSEIFGMLTASAEHGLLCSFHCENHDLTESNKKKFAENNTLSAPYHAYSRPDFHEAEAVGRVIHLAQAADSSIYIVHLSSGAGLEKIRTGQLRGVNVMAETCPQYLFLDDSIYEQKDGYQYLCSPPVRKKGDQLALFEGIKDGVISVVATDHCPFKRAQKEPFKDDFRNVPMGLPGVETLLPLLVTKSLECPDILDICDVARLVSTAPAKIFGMYPQKGCLYPGSDADLVVIDTDRSAKISAESLHMNIDLSPYEGMNLSGFPEIVISRGEVIVENYTLKAKKGRGRYIHRTPVF